MKQLLLIITFLLPLHAFSQLSESFDGPEITSANPWTGDLNSFAIKDGWLVLQADPESNTASLEISLTYAASMQWDFHLRMDYTPTNYNHFRLHVYQDADEDFYVQVGSNQHTLSLRRQSSTSSSAKTLISEALTLLESPMEIQIRLTLDNHKTWNLYVLEEDTYTLLGSAESAVPSTTNSGPLQIECRYSKTHVNDFAVSEIQVTLNDSSSAEDFEEEEENDSDGEESPYTTGSIRINEVMANPNGLTAFPETEYVELYNMTDQAVDLDDWSFLYGEKATTLTAYTLPADGYVVLYRSGRDIQVDAPGGSLALEKFPSALANSGKELALTDPSGNEIDRISYEKATAGISWERSGNTFYLSTDSRGGTPGSVNSQPDDTEEEEEGKEEDPDEEEETPDTPDDTGEDEESATYATGDLRINEVMANPSGLIAFPETEYVELYNTTDQAIALEGWSFLYGEKAMTLTSYTLSADGYVVLYHSGRDIWVDASGGSLPLEKFPSALANTGRELALLDPSGNEIDRISYEKATAGISWERTGDAFYLSTDSRGGTPGSANSQSDTTETDAEDTSSAEKDSTAVGGTGDTHVLAKEIVFNELLPNPYSGGSEYIELYNRSSRSLSLTGLSIATRKIDETLSTHYSLSSITTALEAGGYALLTKSIEGVEDFYLISSPDALHELKLPVLANTSSTLVLFRTSDETVIDEVNYSSDWHAASIKDEKGVALERIDPDGDTQDENNWTSASSLDGYGTPGYRNSQYGHSDTGTTTGIESPIYSDLTGAYTIPYHLDQSGYTCRAWIYDTAGRRICELANQALLGADGYLTWQGLSASGSKVRTGIYIFYAELAHPQGKVRRYRQAFLVR